MHRSLVLALTLAVGAVACADRNRDARTADDAQQAAAARNSVAVAPPDPPPALPVIAVTPPPAAEPAPEPVAAAAATDDDPVAAAHAAEDARETAVMKEKNKAKWEKIGREADRKATDEYARERLAKLISRADQVRTQISRVPLPRRPQFNSDVVAFSSKKTALESKINSLTATGADQWKAAKEALDRAIDDLEGATTKLEGDVY